MIPILNGLKHAKQTDFRVDTLLAFFAASTASRSALESYRHGLGNSGPWTERLLEKAATMEAEFFADVRDIPSVSQTESVMSSQDGLFQFPK